MPASDLERLIQLLGRLPGLGPRSARRAALHLLKRRDSLMEPLAAALAEAAVSVKNCGTCGNLDSEDPCAICRDPKRDPAVICVVAEVGDLWALERSAAFRGRYHVLGGTLSALDGIGPEQLTLRRCCAGPAILRCARWCSPLERRSRGRPRRITSPTASPDCR